jgi:hypothetical protein
MIDEKLIVMGKYNKVLITLFAIDIAFVFIYIFYLIDIEEIFSKGFEFGQLFYNISLSFIAAVFFYFIIDYYPKKERKIKYLNNMEEHIRQINRCFNDILANFDYSNLNYKIINIENIDSNILKNILANTSCTFKTKVDFPNYPNADIVYLIKQKHIRIQYELNELLRSIDILSPELYKSINDLRVYILGDVIEVGINISNVTDLNLFTNIFMDYINLLRNLNDNWIRNKIN